MKEIHHQQDGRLNIPRVAGFFSTIHSYGRVYPRRKSIQKIPRKLPSGKRLHNYGKSPFSMGKSTLNGHFQ